MKGFSPLSLTTTFILIVAPSVLVLMVLTFLFLDLNRAHNSYQQLIAKQELILLNHSDLLSLPLWNVNDDRVDQMLTNLHLDPDVSGAVVFDDNNNPFSAVGTLRYKGITDLISLENVGKKIVSSNSSQLTRVITLLLGEAQIDEFIAHMPISFKTDFGPEIIGTLFVAVSDNAMQKIRKRYLLSELSSTTISIIAIILTTLLAYWLTTYRPLRQIHNAIKAIKAGTEYYPLRSTGSREIVEVIDAFNEMQNRQRHYDSELKLMALHDHLTGLPNRLLFDQNIEQAISRSKRNKRSFALLFIDLDHFKDINDSLGHDYGDALLIDVAQRLAKRIRHSDTVCRLGGDEFAILLESLEDPSYISLFCDDLLTCIGQPTPIRGHTLHVGCSIGITLYPQDGDDSRLLLKNADSAMYEAKAKGKNCFEFFSEKLRLSAQIRLDMDGAIRDAIDKKELVLYYQPQLDSVNGNYSSIEALIRWNHPQLGLLLPDSFIPIAESSGSILEIGEWVIREACRQNQAWQLGGKSPIPISVNVSARQFRSSELVNSITTILQETQLCPEYLELELTEGTLIHDLDDSQSILEAIRSLGVRIAIDDYGTGYSSLTYLRRFPIQTLKIDRSFISGIEHDKESQIIVAATIEMAHKLGKKVVAEGIETEDQVTILMQMDCDFLQGFLFSKPVVASSMELLFRAPPHEAVKSRMNDSGSTLPLTEDP